MGKDGATHRNFQSLVVSVTRESTQSTDCCILLCVPDYVVLGRDHKVHF